MMKSLILALLLPASLDAAWLHSRKVPMDHTKCGTSNSTNYLFFFTGTYTYLKTTANGGLVLNSNGYDIIFASDPLGASPLNFERVAWDGTTGTVTFFVLVPTVSASVDTVIYILYGNPSISTDQQNAVATWASFSNAWHLSEGSGTTANDSTGSNFGTWTGTQTGTSGYYSPGHVSPWAGTFNGLNVDIGTANTNPNLTGNITVSAWVKFNTTAGFQRILAKWGGTNAWIIEVNPTQYEAWISASSVVGAASATGLNTTSWHLVAETYDGANVRLWVDGVNTATSAATGPITTTAFHVLMGVSDTSTAWLNGLLQECYVAPVARDQSWMTTTFNNQDSPGTFFSVGPQVNLNTTQVGAFLVGP